MLKISPATAQLLALHAQGLSADFSFEKGKEGVLETIRHLGYVQLDTLSVVARAHHHTLWTRAAGYEEKFLDELLREKKIFEYWSHAAAYLPMEDYRFSLLRKNEFLAGRSHWFQKNKKVMRYVLDKIKAEGALQARDFETDRKRGSWFDWKPAKIALEQLFHDGTLMVSERKGFQKVYDLTERILPGEIETTAPTKEEYAAYLVRSALRAHGIASAKDIGHLRKGMQPSIQKVLKKMLRDGEIVPVKIEGVKEAYFGHKAQIQRFNDLKIKRFNDLKSNILSPFDNLVIRRERLKNIFGYDYAIECYLPEHKRTFGYFCLPVLYENNFVGRFDPKADRGSKTFIVKQFHLEHPPRNTDAFLSSFAKSLKEFAVFNNCKKIVVEKVYPAKLKLELKRAIR